MDFMPFFLLSLAVWRVSSLFAREDGIFNLFIRFRGLIGVRELGTENEYGENWLSKGIICVFCNSIWFSAVTAIFVATNLYEWLLYTLALSAMAIILDSHINR